MLSIVWQRLTAPPNPEKGVLGIIAWWEIRRFRYNAVVGAFGVMCLVLFFIFIVRSGELRAGEDAVEPMALILAPIAANILYTAGWIAHILLRLAGIRSPRVGPVLWVAGTALSLLVVAMPAVYWGAMLAINGALR